MNYIVFVVEATPLDKELIQLSVRFRFDFAFVYSVVKLLLL
jgi:hypothetical protein